FGPVLVLFALPFLLVFFWVSRLLAPLNQITAAIQHYSSGDEHDFPLPLKGSDDVRSLAEALNAMVATLREQRQALATHTRFAAWREIAREVAHEMKNLLTPLRLASEGLIERCMEQGDSVIQRDAAAIQTAFRSLQTMNSALQDISLRRPLHLK